MQLFAMISQFLLGICLIVGLHELGHMLFAKLFGMRVESFTIGFPPKIIQAKWGETVYGIGAIPLGGSVKIAGMIDESLDTENLDDKPQPWEFRAKPAWQRLLVTLGGITFNTVSGILIYIVITFALGETYITKDEVNKHGIVPNAIGVSIGLQEKDQIVSINGKNFTRFSDIMDTRALLQAGAYYTVLRQGKTIRIDIPSNFLECLANSQGQQNFVTPLLPFAIGEVLASSQADRAGLKPGDQIIEIAGQAVPYLHQCQAILAAYTSNQVIIKYIRDGVLYYTTAQVDETGKLGFYPQILLDYVHQQYSLLKAIAIGTTKALEILRINAMALKKMLTGQLAVSKSLSGPIGIAKIFNNKFDWVHFWSAVGFLSLILAFTNLLPIPVLDGGHAALISYEMVMGRKISNKFLVITQKIGLAILALLIGYAIFNDLCKLF